jgi:WhiB family transcriptional regulator, redox-sensing transcriptional regulator
MRGPDQPHGGVHMSAIEISTDRIQLDDDWMLRGACKGLTHLFFPTAAERPQARERREASAREVCGSCAVQGQCVEFARRHHEYGFWGGESEDERHAAGFRLIAPIGIRARAS